MHKKSPYVFQLSVLQASIRQEICQHAITYNPTLGRILRRLIDTAGRCTGRATWRRSTLTRSGSTWRRDSGYLVRTFPLLYKCIRFRSQRAHLQHSPGSDEQDFFCEKNLVLCLPQNLSETSSFFLYLLHQSQCNKTLYRPHPKDGVPGTVFMDVCLSTPGGVPHLHPIILPLVPCPFGGYPSDWLQTCPFSEGTPVPDGEGMGYPPARDGSPWDGGRE